MLSRVQTLYGELPRMSYGMFNKKFPITTARTMNFFVKLLLFLLPKSLVFLIPIRVRYLTLMACHSLNISEKKIDKLLCLRYPIESADLVRSYSISRDYYQHGIIPDFLNQLESVRDRDAKTQNKTLKEIIQWSFWTLNHKDFYNVNLSVQSFLTSLQSSRVYSHKRYLPQHTSNMGHLAMLFLYINYYRTRDPKRTIILPETVAANEYFLKMIMRQSPLRIEFASKEEFETISPTLVDTLHYSLDVDGSYRTESDCAFFSNQDHPEFTINQEFRLALSDEEQKIGREVLVETLGLEPKWFVILHVREPKNGDLNFSQSRDANISTYSEVADVVVKMGGIVIRMGDKNFPVIPKNFQAFDYAHSSIKSEFMDCWLWANCNYWIGTVNGAAFPPIAFGKKRLLLEQWYWYKVGPVGDFAMRKRLQIGNREMIWEEVLESRISRCMERQFLRKAGVQLIEAEPRELSEIAKAFLEGSEHEKLAQLKPNGNLNISTH